MVGLERTTNDLNRLWLDSFQFLDELNNKRLNYDKALYRLNELSADMRVEKPAFLSTRTWLIAILAAVFGAFIGLFSFIWRRALKG